MFVRCYNYRIHGKEDSIDQFEEESEVYKDKNDQLKEKVSMQADIDQFIILIFVTESFSKGSTRRTLQKTGKASKRTRKKA